MNVICESPQRFLGLMEYRRVEKGRWWPGRARTFHQRREGIRHPSIRIFSCSMNDRAQISKTSPTKQPPSANFTHRDVLANPILALSKNVQMAAEIDLLLLCPSEILALKHARVGFSDSGLTLYLVQGRANSNCLPSENFEQKSRIVQMLSYLLCHVYF